MSGIHSTELRDISAVGAELDESELSGVSGGRIRNEARTTCKGSVYDDWS
ncbi:hypothetical protein HS041_03690 [Planomonospora sp. ID67723]|nr:hypothetical protein [Planomonospora sp. ID67723]MBG0826875.1 hypothetical protein [Planomonospora sp. ID67723]